MAGRADGLCPGAGVVPDDRYQECLARVMAYRRSLKCNEWAKEGLIRSYLEQPAYDVTLRKRLLEAALSPEKR